MNNVLNPQVFTGIADVLRKPFAQRRSSATAGMTPDPPPAADQPASGILAFIGNLVSSPALSGFLGSGRPEAAVLHGSLAGLATGLDAVTDESAAGEAQVKRRPLVAVLTVCAYIVGGIAAAMIYRAMQRSAQATPI
jgi:hypothetical protein